MRRNCTPFRSIHSRPLRRNARQNRHTGVRLLPTGLRHWLKLHSCVRDWLLYGSRDCNRCVQRFNLINCSFLPAPALFQYHCCFPYPCCRRAHKEPCTTNCEGTLNAFPLCVAGCVSCSQPEQYRCAMLCEWPGSSKKRFGTFHSFFAHLSLVECSVESIDAIG